MSKPMLDRLIHMQIPVPHLEEAVSWYEKFLGFKVGGKRDGAHAFMNLPSGPMLMLWETSDTTSANFTVQGETFPTLLYQTNRIHELYSQLKELGVEITFYQDEGFGWVLKFYDPYGNMWGVIQEKQRIPFESRIGNVFVPVGNMPKAVMWYRDIFGLKPDENYTKDSDPQVRTVYSIKLHEISLLLDSMQRESLSASPNHLFTLETNDLHEAYRYLKDKGVEFTDTEETILGNPQRRAFGFKDSEGNILIMHQS